MSEEIFVNGEHHIGLGKHYTSDMAPDGTYSDEAGGGSGDKCAWHDYPYANRRCVVCDRENRLKKTELMAMPRRREEHNEYMLSCILKCVLVAAVILSLIAMNRSLRDIAGSLDVIRDELHGISEAEASAPAVDFGGIRSDLSGIKESIDAIKEPLPEDNAEPVAPSGAYDGGSGDDVSGGVWQEVVDDGHGWMGVTVSDGSAAAGEENVVHGAVIIDLVKGGPADKAGMGVGELVIKIDKTEITGSDSFIEYLKTKAPGDRIRLTVIENGATSPKEYEVALVGLDSLENAGTAK